MAWKNMFQKTLMMIDDPEVVYQSKLKRQMESALSDIDAIEQNNIDDLEKAACLRLENVLSNLDLTKFDDLEARAEIEEIYVKAGAKHAEMQKSGRCWEWKS